MTDSLTTKVQNVLPPENVAAITADTLESYYNDFSIDGFFTILYNNKNYSLKYSKVGGADACKLVAADGTELNLTIKCEFKFKTGGTVIAFNEDGTISTPFPSTFTNQIDFKVTIGDAVWESYFKVYGKPRA